MGKSFYDLDYIIEINEKRLAEYTALYQKVLERLTNIILVYSALGIFLVPLTQRAIAANIKGVWFYLAYFCFVILLVISVVYLIRLLLPIDIAYLDPPRKYYGEYKANIEGLNIGNEEVVDDSLKGAYVLELENAIEINSRAFLKKSSFFYNALLFALVAIIPYIVCLGFHFSKKEDKVEKVEILKGKS
ncbi:MAG TPA: hypothetical protein VL727_13305 [Puia sp.]|jgi:hypothetical protein|nr:hypothetical protein [Puia sp.]